MLVLWRKNPLLGVLNGDKFGAVCRARLRLHEDLERAQTDLSVY